MRPAIHRRSGELFIEGVSARRLARSVGTPAYVYSSAAVVERYRALDSAFKATPHLICYALKANSNAAVVRLLAGEGAGADIVSGGELVRALSAGVPASRIVYSGVGKTRAEMRRALAAGIRAFNVESEEELAALSACARAARKAAPVSVRVNPDVAAGGHAHITTGRAEDKFGVPAKTAFAMLKRAAKDRWLRPVGLQSHIGSQILSVEPFRKSLRQTLRLADALADSGVNLAHVDVGGGMGVRYQNERPFAPEALASALRPLLKNRPRLTLLLEPGRWLVAEAGLLLVSVLYRKTGKRRFVVVDGAMNDLLRPALYGAYHEIVPAGKSGAAVSLDVVGPVCETGDFFARGRRLPWPEPGDVWAVLQAGAYGFSMSSQYNSRPRPPEILVSGRKWRLARLRERESDLTRHERTTAS